MLAGCSRGGLASVLNEMRGDPYALDDFTRDVQGDAGCPTVELTSHRGTPVPFQPPVRVVPAFAERLAQFEAAVDQLGRAMFGRPPRAVRHAGAYLCRPIRQRSGRWSEHAFGNAVDVVGFDFPRMPRGEAGVTTSAELPASLRGAFEIRVVKHWSAGPDPAEQLRQGFLRRLVLTLSDRDVFRAMIGPADPAHKTHLHFDMGPWRYQRL